MASTATVQVIHISVPTSNFQWQIAGLGLGLGLGGRPPLKELPAWLGPEMGPLFCGHHGNLPGKEEGDKPPQARGSGGDGKEREWCRWLPTCAKDHIVHCPDGRGGQGPMGSKVAPLTKLSPRCLLRVEVARHLQGIRPLEPKRQRTGGGGEKGLGGCNPLSLWRARGQRA